MSVPFVHARAARRERHRELRAPARFDDVGLVRDRLGLERLEVRGD
jgi:hypothetical protein